MLVISWRRRVLALFGCGAVALASCGGGDGVPDAVTPESSATSSSIAGTTGDATTPTDAPPDAPPCDSAQGVEIIDVGSAVEMEIVGQDQPPPDKRYFCVEIDDGVRAITVELTGATADLDLFVGYGSLQAVQEGGFAFWSSNERGVVDERILIEPGLSPDELGQLQEDEHVMPGAYYLEVAPQDFEASSPFTLEVGTE